ncbi:nucleoside hydrolase [Acinetobacter sp. MD2(2019)]|uniref:nucleoside hydrolase n=1 Tax=Acinetobacter sp. MD2(2019) TaxID=2605273 RepID=UPI002D1EE533|nr:nucleoside hydrolase [Acinetobacter sp. MD2(2019)]MEB3754776.1 nucleoside hydrolase [Acinetobacter sp. MD2(2019)]
MSQAPTQIIIDTDPGQDDAVAILLALASPELNVLGITTVAGNVPLALTHVNARKVCELAGRTDIPVFAGCDKPLKRDLITAENVHGKTGLDGIELPAPSMPLQAQHSVDFIIKTLRNAPEKTITICSLGPMTNTAQALLKAPDIASRIAKIVLMGGGFFEGGNITPSAEFNMFVDPDAAKVVFAAGIPLTVVPLDVTHKALTSKAWVDGLRAMNNQVGPAVAAWTDFFERYDMEKYGSEGAPLHDPCVIGYMLKPELFTGRQINVEIEADSPLTVGATVADWWYVTGRTANAEFLNTINRDGFFDLLTERLSRYA